ncbi:MAG: hypothetical protein ACTSRW_17385 [Candidatus Helarchaeota archaeon]
MMNKFKIKYSIRGKKYLGNYVTKHREAIVYLSTIYKELKKSGEEDQLLDEIIETILHEFLEDFIKHEEKVRIPFPKEIILSNVVGQLLYPFFPFSF